MDQDIEDNSKKLNQTIQGIDQKLNPKGKLLGIWGGRVVTINCLLF